MRVNRTGGGMTEHGTDEKRAGPAIALVCGGCIPASVVFSILGVLNWLVGMWDKTVFFVSFSMALVTFVVFFVSGSRLCRQLRRIATQLSTENRDRLRLSGKHEERRRSISRGQVFVMASCVCLIVAGAWLTYQGDRFFACLCYVVAGHLVALNGGLSVLRRIRAEVHRISDRMPTDTDGDSDGRAG